MGSSTGAARDFFNAYEKYCKAHNVTSKDWETDTVKKHIYELWTENPEIHVPYDLKYIIEHILKKEIQEGKPTPLQGLINLDESLRKELIAKEVKIKQVMYGAGDKWVIEFNHQLYDATTYISLLKSSIELLKKVENLLCNTGIPADHIISKPAWPKEHVFTTDNMPFGMTGILTPNALNERLAKAWEAYSRENDFVEKTKKAAELTKIALQDNNGLLALDILQNNDGMGYKFAFRRIC